MIDSGNEIPPQESATEKWLTLAQAARLLPTRPAPSTLWRWARKGVRGVHLEYRRLGGKIVVTEQGIRHFMDELTKRDNEAPLTTPQFADPSGVKPPLMSKGQLEAELRRERLL